MSIELPLDPSVPGLINREHDGPRRGITSDAGGRATPEPPDAGVPHSRAPYLHERWVGDGGGDIDLGLHADLDRIERRRDCSGEPT
eukprot:CAMPEP_0181218606 /NCGR_PEP_ID=MMETSP1096-20121128/27785_1 /TAXON_ID=156174 ORGANISM="Chrysochromulina ericina, Strain CCMP281" /NCGR_SAMPLE_ID=MMETSP1096 /ASSEMBLY_ACC=CAM_ASM_000453 /LENGTH=85 /DNA_ID=CAMNT_0023310837 /DNA_START=280 /DNA_END=533 /DNA_ORIENTATION=-